MDDGERRTIEGDNYISALMDAGFDMKLVAQIQKSSQLKDEFVYDNYMKTWVKNRGYYETEQQINN